MAYGPGAPTGVSAIAGDATAKVSFTAPADSGSSAITSYTVTATDTTEASRGGQQATGAGGPIVVAGLTTGDVYTFTVKATNGVGTGLASAPSSAVTAEGAATTTGLASSANPSASGQSVTFTATVAPAPEGGTVAFEVDGATAERLHGERRRPEWPGHLRGLEPGRRHALGRGHLRRRRLLQRLGVRGAGPGRGVARPDAPPADAAAATPVATTPFPSDAVIIAGLEAVSRITRTSRALSFTQRIITRGTISWRLDLSFYLPKKSSRATRRKPIRVASGRRNAATQPSIRRTIRLDARARGALKRHPPRRLVLRTTLRLPSGRTIHATKTLSRR